MKKYFITGFSGFVSKHFIDYLEINKLSSKILGVDVIKPSFSKAGNNYVDWKYQELNLLDKDKLENIIYHFNPDYIIHFAAYSSVAFSWKNPVVSFKNNTNIFLNLIDAVRVLDLKCKILAIGSSEIYGNINEDELPLTELSKLNPISPYAVARVSQELILKVYVESFGINIILTRSFNHIGPGQKDVFVIPSFAKQLVELSKNNKAGETHTVREFIELTCKEVGVDFEWQGNGIDEKGIDKNTGGIIVEVDSRYYRPTEVDILLGNPEKAKKELGWESKHKIHELVSDMVRADMLDAKKEKSLIDNGYKVMEYNE